MGILRLVPVAALAFGPTVNPVAADETVEQMVEAALPLMYHTCDSVVEETGGDEAEIIDVVKKMVALVLVNRNIDISDYIETEEDTAKIREGFITALREGCEADRNALLGGIVDTSVKQTLGL